MSRKNMRAPRRLDVHHKALSTMSLNDKAPPPVDSISWKLWLACQDIAREALGTDYIQGIKNGNLDPNIFGQYTVQDAVYCHHAEGDYQTIENRALAAGYPELAAFARARRDSYVAYDAETFKAWHISDASALSPSKAVQTYIAFEHFVATEQPPVYGIIAMVPCDQLWPFLATELKGHAGDGNLYSFWITGNADWGGAYRLDNFIDDWFAEHMGVFEWDLALFVFQSCMTCEVNFFRSACGQPLLPMPERPHAA